MSKQFHSRRHCKTIKTFSCLDITVSCKVKRIKKSQIAIILKGGIAENNKKVINKVLFSRLFRHIPAFEEMNLALEVLLCEIVKTDVAFKETKSVWCQFRLV